MKKKSSTDSFEVIPMDVVVLSIFPFYEHEVTKISTLHFVYGYFRRDRTRKIYYLFSSLYFAAFPSFRTPHPFPNLLNIERIQYLNIQSPTEPMMNILRKLSPFAKKLIGIEFFSCHSLIGTQFSEKKCFPALEKIKFSQIRRNVDTSKWGDASHLWPKLTTFHFNSMYELNMLPEPLKNENIFRNLLDLHLSNIEPSATLCRKLFLPKLQKLRMEECSNIDLLTGKSVRSFRISFKNEVQQRMAKNLFHRLNPEVLENFFFSSKRTVEQAMDCPWLFDGKTCKPLSKFKNLKKISIGGITVSDHEALLHLQVFPHQNLSELRVWRIPMVDKYLKGTFEKMRTLSVQHCPSFTGVLPDAKNLLRLGVQFSGCKNGLFERQGSNVESLNLQDDRAWEGIFNVSSWNEFPNLKIMIFTDLRKIGDDLFINFVKKFRQVEKILLSGCSKITGEELEKFGTVSIRIKALVLENCENLTDTFFRFVDFKNLKLLLIEGCKKLKGEDWNASYRTNLEGIRISKKEFEFVQRFFEGHKLNFFQFWRLKRIVLSQIPCQNWERVEDEDRSEKRWAGLPALSYVRCPSRFFEKVKEKLQGNANFDTIRFRSN